MPLQKDNFIWSEKYIIWSIIFTCSILLTFKYYPGIENSTYYAGFILRAIDPTLMPLDPIVGDEISGHSPYKVTIYYFLPKIFGTLWLDDRFVVFFYLATVIFTFWLADKTAVALGAKNIFIRASVLLIFVRDHQVIENLVNFAHQPDFHHSALAIPASLSVIYLSLKYRNILLTVVAGLSISLISIQIAPFTLGFALLAIAVASDGKNRKIAVSILVFGAIAFIALIFKVMPVPASDRVALWNLIVSNWYEGMVAPFDVAFYQSIWDAAAKNTMFIALLSAAALWPANGNKAVKGAKAIFGISLLIFICLGLYGQFAPDALKYPELILFAVTRQLQTPQILAVICLIVLCLNWMQRDPSIYRGLGAFITVLFLVILGPGNHLQWGVLFVLSSLAVVIILTPKARPISDGFFTQRLFKLFPMIIFLALFTTMTIATAGSAHQKFSDWKILFATGVHGASASAKWINISRYLAENTPKSAVVLPFEYTDPAKQTALGVRRNIASRSGRAVPWAMRLSKGLNLEWFLYANKLYDQHKTISAAWMARDVKKAVNVISEIHPTVDYVVIPDDVIVGLNMSPWFEQITSLDGYSILKVKAP
tara:strand:+ start:288 stop:2075 length:1788 start_codon:yes stop_codon:yes gene_type:complete